ncbi:MAG TPA: ABC transporter permease [bacterium]|jgi:peptide/nickel transport system permease protein|nr:ABC transporter permease [bacterium]HON72798.1 ABC transporter permease [bacterium]HPC78360.1 ABC transporter permease [bacterium]HPO82488.1 ABC transporter permease [bacterium]HRR91883.1 ABC transporter permease [bacterium]
MTFFIVRRLLLIIPLFFILSIVSFVIIQLPPGDYLTVYIEQLRRSGALVDEASIARLVKEYGLDQPIYKQYFIWMKNIITQGNFGRSLQWNKPINELIGERLSLSVLLSVLSIILTWFIGIPIGIYSAIRQYSAFDYIFTFFGFIGLSIPSFLLALIIIWLVYSRFGLMITGLFSQAYADAPWTLAKVIDMFKHVWVPVLIIGMSGTAGLIRTMRANLLDELRKQYVIVARAKGLPERKLLFKYPVRIAINPMISTIGWMLPSIFSGETIVSIVLNLPTMGPLFMQALLAQDMYLAGSFVLIISFLTLLGTLISDILLAWIDPRIRYENVGGS